MDKIYTVADAAEIVGCSLRTAYRHVRTAGLGTPVGKRGVILAAADVELLRGMVNDGPGNPEFGPEFRNRKVVKKSSKKRKPK